MTLPPASWVRADALAARSVEVLLEGQAPSGAFVASPSFNTYSFSWFRDGAFCARALDVVGEHEAAHAFHIWAARAVAREAAQIRAIEAQLAAGKTPREHDMLPARYTLDGEREARHEEVWPNFQLDGYGLWLDELRRHLDEAPPEGVLREGAVLAADYLQAAWRLPCYDCWEEYGCGEHAATLAAVAAGLESATHLIGDERYAQVGEQIRRYILSEFVRDGYIWRGRTDPRVDGSLLWLANVNRLAAPDDPRISATVARVRDELRSPGGGIWRYRGDTYYGGGEWLLLTCSLALHDALIGERGEFERVRGWVRAQASPEGALPEQVLAHVQDEAMIAEWEARWGPVATPLLWSHAMYLLMEDAGAEAGWNSRR